MNIQDGLLLEPTFYIPRHGMKGVEIPDVGRDDFALFLAENGYKVGVEVGVDSGEYGVTLCKAGLKVYGVDPYVSYYDYKLPNKGSNKNHYEVAAANLKEYDYTFIKKFSMEALNDFEDNSLDFVYIDGNHTLPYVSQDILEWQRKVKKGGIISGHDYGYIKGRGEKKEPFVFDGGHVNLAVDACTYIMGIPRLYILGRKVSEKGEKRDKWRSWFFFKTIKMPWHDYHREILK